MSDPEIYVAGGGDGSMGFEFWHGQSRLLVDVMPNGDVEFYLRIENGDEEEVTVSLTADNDIPASLASTTFHNMFEKLMAAPSDPLPSTGGNTRMETEDRKA